MTPQTAPQTNGDDAEPVEGLVFARSATVPVRAPTGGARPPTPTTPAARQPTATGPHTLPFAERQRLALLWVGMTFGLLLLLSGLALWAAVALGAGFGGWLLGTGLLGLVLLAVVATVNYIVLRPPQATQ